MKINDIIHIIKQGENEKTEFKSSFNKEVIETIVAFANKTGGSVYIGISKTNKIVGVNINSESVQNWINEIKSKTTPSLIPDSDLINIDDKTVVLLRIPEYPIKPVSTQGKYFKRVFNSNHLLSTDEIANEHLKTINTSWDYYPSPYHNIDDIDLDKVKSFITQIQLKNDTKITLSALEFLNKFELIRKNQLTLGAYLLFVKNHCLISDVQVGRFKSEITIIDSRSLNTDLFTEVNEILSFIRKHLMVEYIITGEPQRTERFDFPPDAIREIVINMIVHRDYASSSASIIKIFDNRIEFFNPGSLYDGLTINDLLSDNYTSKTRNKLIAKAFKEVGLIERYGSGIKRILNICDNYGIIPPKFEEVFSGFRVTLFKEKTKPVGELNGELIGELIGELNERQNKVYLEIKNNEGINATALSKKLNIPFSTVDKYIRLFLEKNLIVRKGSKKTGGYFIS
jgi:ATP-dependent DNA helicase RecG